jgi:hypothetical protein
MYRRAFLTKYILAIFNLLLTGMTGKIVNFYEMAIISHFSSVPYFYFCILSCVLNFKKPHKNILQDFNNLQDSVEGH